MSNIIDSVLLHPAHYVVPNRCVVNVKSHMRTSNTEVMQFLMISCAYKPVEPADLLLVCSSTNYKQRSLRWADWEHIGTEKHRDWINEMKMEDNSIPGFKYQILVLV